MSVDETVHTVCCLCIWIDLLFMSCVCAMRLAAPTLNAYLPIHGRPSFLLGLCPSSVCGELLVDIYFILCLRVCSIDFAWVPVTVFLSYFTYHWLPPGSFILSQWFVFVIYFVFIACWQRHICLFEFSVGGPPQRSVSHTRHCFNIIDKDFFAPDSN